MEQSIIIFYERTQNELSATHDLQPVFQPCKPSDYSIYHRASWDCPLLPSNSMPCRFIWERPSPCQSSVTVYYFTINLIPGPQIHVLCPIYVRGRIGLPKRIHQHKSTEEMYVILLLHIPPMNHSLSRRRVNIVPYSLPLILQYLQRLQKALIFMQLDLGAQTCLQFHTYEGGK